MSLKTRITSYNVCYTKLLRQDRGPAPGHGRHEGRSGHAAAADTRAMTGDHEPGLSDFV